MKGDRTLNTGKVLVGLYYQPPVRMPALSADAARLQAALLRKPQQPGAWQRLLRALRKAAQ